jgi:epoxyqueuosine reductase
MDSLPSTAAELTRAIKERALGLGFDAVGVVAVEPLEDREHLARWLARGFHGAMDYMRRNAARRADPGLVLEGCRSVVCVALAYGPARDPERDARLGRFARYAVGQDYHRVFGEKLEALCAWLAQREPRAQTLWYVDTGPVLERAWAERAGLGWIGKHSGLLSRDRGSWFLLGEVLVDVELEPDRRATHHCGTCTACLEACPTRAIIGPYQLDARLCISYLTIELRGPIPRALRPLVGDHVFGCDLCQEVCPWNRFAREAHEARLAPLPALARQTLAGFLVLDEAGFRGLFATSPIRRARRAGFLRNVCVALGNRADPASVPALLRALQHDPEPLVRGHAAWALGRILALAAPPVEAAVAASVRAALAAAAHADVDAAAREEARLALEESRAG